MKKKIYAVLLLTAVCAGSGVFAQSSAPKENLEKYYTLERIRSKSGWLVSDNAAGLMLNQASLSIAEVNYDFEQGYRWSGSECVRGPVRVVPPLESSFVLR